MVFFEDGNWHLRDTSSRNGTHVNGQKTDHARLLDKSVITVGSTDMQLVEPDLANSDEGRPTETLIREAHPTGTWRLELEDPIADVASAGHLLDLYSLSLNLLKNESHDGIIDTVIELLKDRTCSDVVGLSFDAGDGRIASACSTSRLR